MQDGKISLTRSSTGKLVNSLNLKKEDKENRQHFDVYKYYRREQMTMGF